MIGRSTIEYSSEAFSIEVFAALTDFVYNPSPWPSPARGEGMQGTSTDVSGQLDVTAQLEAINAIEKNFPSPLAGEGQGEGGRDNL